MLAVDSSECYRNLPERKGLKLSMWSHKIKLNELSFLLKMLQIWWNPSPLDTETDRFRFRQIYS